MKALPASQGDWKSVKVAPWVHSAARKLHAECVLRGPRRALGGGFKHLPVEVREGRRNCTIGDLFGVFALAAHELIGKKYA
jgi:hypothetical protein